MIVLGIDIGVTGALAAVGHSGTAAIVDLPTEAMAGTATVRRQVSATGLRDVIRHYVAPGEVAMALIEDVHMGMGKGGAARSSLDRNRGRIEAVLELMRIQVHAVQPRTWKRFYGMAGSDKQPSLDMARSLYPTQTPMLKRKKDHNRAEALLLAHYGLKVKA